MTELFKKQSSRNQFYRYPEHYFNNYESREYLSPPAPSIDHDGWVTARFSPHYNHEQLIYLGDDPGNIGIYDVSDLIRITDSCSEPRQPKSFFSAHDGAIMDIVGVPNKPNNIVSISGDSTIRCWDITQSSTNKTCETFLGHEGSVRSVCFQPDCSNVFATGARDGHLKIWDMRVSVCKKMDKFVRKPTVSYSLAHPAPTDKTLTPRTKSKTKPVGSSVTSVVFLNEHIVASASSTADSGIRIWDIRKPTPCSTLRIPVNRRLAGKTGFGITCLAVDRYKSSLFASATNSMIYEYAVTTSDVSPVNVYTGATIRDYYTQVACSPVADAFAVGSDDSRALVYDLQNQHNYRNDLVTPNETDLKRTYLPKWVYGGHENKVLCVGWSSNANYFLSLDDRGLRIWNEKKQLPKWKCCETEQDYKEYESSTKTSMHISVQPYCLSSSEKAVAQIDEMSLTPRRRVNSFSYRSPVKPSKRPLVTSPFKKLQTSPLRQSPRAKMSKLAYSPGLPFHDSSNFKADIELANHTPKMRRKKTVNSFFLKYPTKMLPNIAYDNFLRKLLGNTEENKSLSKTSRKRLNDWWSQTTTIENCNTETKKRLPSVSEFGESVCAKVIPEEERNALLSPKKLIVKNSTTANYKLTTSNRPDIPVKKTSRNLLHYFSKT